MRTVDAADCGVWVETAWFGGMVIGAIAMRIVIYFRERRKYETDSSSNEGADAQHK